MNKFVRVMDGLKSNAGGFEYKLDEINIANNWNYYFISMGSGIRN